MVGVCFFRAVWGRMVERESEDEEDNLSSAVL
jgi:hypothetical protein